MNIVVCIKQVPDTQDIQWTDKGTMIREGVESIINPYDEYALECALSIKDRYPDSKITAVSMGPLQAQELLKIAIAKGVDEGILICDKKFAGADTFATSYTIACAIKKYIPDFDLILCGQFAIDGDTAQTPPSLAGQLNINQVTFVNKLIDINYESIILQRETEEGFTDVQVRYPCLISLLKSDENIRNYTINGYINSYNKEIKIVNREDICADENMIGFKGSPTFVSRTFPPQFNRDTQELTLCNDEDVLSFIQLIKQKSKEGK